MARYSDTVRDQYGAPVIGALVAVTLSSTGEAPALTDDEGAVLANPVTTDGYGIYYFNIVGAAYVDLKFYYGGRLVQEQFGVAVGAPPPVAGAGGTNGQAQYNNAGSLGGFDGLTIGSEQLKAVSIVQGVLTTPQYGYTHTATWSDPVQTYGAFQITVNKSAAGNERHTLIDASCTDGAGMKLISTGDILLNPGAGYGSGIRAGFDSLEFTSRLDTVTGNPRAAKMAAMFWDGTTGSAAILHGYGSNRFSLESDGVINLIPANGRIEMEGFVGFGINNRIQIVPYQAATSISRPLDINDIGTTGSPVGPLASFTSVFAGRKLVSFGGWTGGTYNEKSFIGNDGTFTMGDRVGAPATPTAGGTLYVEGGALKYIGSSGTITTLAPA